MMGESGENWVAEDDGEGRRRDREREREREEGKRKVVVDATLKEKDVM